MEQFDQKLIKEAAQWLVRLENSDSPGRVMDEIEGWRIRSPQHDRAWALAAQLSENLKALPALPGEASEALEAARSVNSRRRAIRTLMLVGVSAASTALVANRLPWRTWTAAYQTASGERQKLPLANGGDVVLNTASAIDIDHDRRNIWLRSGEIMVSRESISSDDELLVHTRDGDVSLRGGRTSIYVQSSTTRVAALKGTAELSGGGYAMRQTLPEGKAGEFDAAGSLTLLPASLNDEVWEKGLIYADKTPLPDFIALLARYSRGVIRCNHALADLSISGLYNYADISAILSFVARNYPVSIRSITPMWISIDRA